MTTSKPRSATQNSGTANGFGPRPSLTDLAYQQIETLIVTLEIPPGTVFSEVQICERLAIGRTPVREALQALSHSRLISVLPRRGYEVDEVRIEDQFSHLELRRELDRLAVKSAARRATEPERIVFAALGDGFREALRSDSFDDFARLDAEFNELCAVTCRNEFLATTMRMWDPVGRRFWFVNYGRDLPETGVLCHAEIAEGIAEGDADKALDASDRLHQSIGATVRDRFRLMSQGD